MAAAAGTETEAIVLAKETVRSIYAEAAGERDDDERAKLGKWAAASEAAGRLAAMLSLAHATCQVRANRRR
jgi:hypothetical protein